MELLQVQNGLFEQPRLEVLYEFLEEDLAKNYSK